MPCPYQDMSGSLKKGDISYGSYLQLDRLLELQQPQSQGPEHDETLFVVIHQVYELWFKQILHEFKPLLCALESQDPTQAFAPLRRIVTIWKTLVSQVDILETMTPLSFSSFRAALARSSGFQSLQFRKIEALLGGWCTESATKLPFEGSDQDSLLACCKQSTVFEAWLKGLAQAGYMLDVERMPRAGRLASRKRTASKDDFEDLDSNILNVLEDVYRNDPRRADLCELLIDLDEGIQEWRYRHVKMVERTLGGRRMGTGGSAGTAYLQSTLFAPFFPYLWAVRERF